MSDSKEHFDVNQEFEIALRAIAPAAPARSAADIAFEAGRREAISQQRQTLWIHRAATAGAILVAGAVGVRALVQPPVATRPSPLVAQTQPGNDTTPQLGIAHSDSPMDRLSGEARPLSYLSLRSAILDAQEHEIEPTTPTFGSGGHAPANTPSVADFLREQRGL